MVTSAEDSKIPEVLHRECDVSLLPGGDTGKRADVKTSILHSALKPMFFTCINTGLKNIQSV